MADRELETFSVVGGQNENISDVDSNPVEFFILVNAYANKRIGAILGRNGSLTETISGTLGVPLGMGELKVPAQAALIPIKRELLQNFGGSLFRKFESNVWSSVTKDSDANFSSSKVMATDQLADILMLASGRPNKWKGGSNNVDPVGIPAPTTAPTVALGAAGVPDGTFTYIYTFLNSTTGLESDWSPVSVSISPSSQRVELTALETTTAAPGVDTKRIYRAEAEIFRLVGTTTLAATTFSDNIATSALGQESVEQFERALPPDAFILFAFNKRFWVVDQVNPFIVRFSKPFIDDSNELEYFPIKNGLIADEPVTGAIRVENRALVFHPRNISYISGFTEADFVFLPFHQGVGTLFPNSICTNGEDVFFLAEEGFMTLGPGGRRHVSRPIDETLQPIIGNRYNSSLYVSCAWSPALRQFLFLISAISNESDPWIVSGDGQLAEWVDSTSGLVEGWQDSATPGTEETTRVFLGGYSAETEQWSIYQYAQIEDLNADGAFGTHLFTPLPSSDTLDPQQDKTYMGIFDGTDGQILTTHRRDKSMDDMTSILAKLLTGRIVPGRRDGSIKRIHSIQFQSAYSDPTINGNLRYLLDLEDPIKQGFISALKTFTPRGDLQVPEKGKGRFIHLYLETSLTTTEEILMTDFGVWYRETLSRQQR